jgi:ketosteroid isomerase-like protein
MASSGIAMVACALAVASQSGDQQVSPSSTAPLVQLVEDQARAIGNFDQQMLSRLLAPDYREISPVGDVDERDAVIGFYAPANRMAGPSLRVSEIMVHQNGDMAVMSAKLTYAQPRAATAPPNASAPPERSLRAGYTARRYPDGWKLEAIQYTPIRTPPAGASPQH